MPDMTASTCLEDPIVQNMRGDFCRLGVKQTVGEALGALRQQALGQRIIYFYVVDEENHLKGVLPTRRLLLSDPGTPIADIMVREVIAIPDTATVLDACEFFLMHRFLAFPVIDAQRRIVGVVDAELYTDELSGLEQKERQDDLFQLIGVHLAESRQASVLAAFRGRFPWLLSNVLGGILAAFFVRLFEAELQRAVALALFIPVVLALSESVGIQSLSLALQWSHGRPSGLARILAKARSELGVGSLLGAACGLTVAGISLVWLGQAPVALCLLGGIAGGVMCSAVVGVVLPNLLRVLKRDPHLASGPIALAVADILTLLIYFSLARQLIA